MMNAYALRNTHYQRTTQYNDPRTRQTLYSVTKIYKGGGSNQMQYVGISGTNQFNANQLFSLFHAFSALFPLCLPETLFPQQFDRKDNIFPAKCFIEQPLKDFKSDWFFESVSLYDKETGLYEEKPLYFTTQFKVALYNLIKQVMLFIREQALVHHMRPVINLKLMFVDKCDHVIFTKYQKRMPADDFPSEINKLCQLLDTIYILHGKNSPTLLHEISDLKEFLRNAANSDAVLQGVLSQIVFWSRHVRVNYVYQLTDRMFTDLPTCPATRNTVYMNSPLAFSALDGSLEWVDIFRNSQNRILKDAFKLGNLYIDQHEQHHQFRTYNITNENDQFKFFSCLVRFRDIFMHIGEYGIVDEHGCAVTDVHMQAILQDLFPRHMADLKRSVNLVSPDLIKSWVKGEIGESQDEA